MNQEKIGKFITECRKNKKMTQSDLAEKLGISINAVSKWERGICLMDMSLLKPLSEILEVEISEILNGEKIKNETDREQILEKTIDYQINKEKKKESKFISIIFIISIIEMVLINLDKFIKSDSLEYLFLISLGVIITILGIFNYKGNIGSVHWYNRRNVTKENAPKYAKLIGMGTIIMGIGLVLSSIFQVIFKMEELSYIVIGSIVIGFSFILYAQIKYNRGLFWNWLVEIY